MYYALPLAYVSLDIERKTIPETDQLSLIVTAHEPKWVPDLDHVYSIDYDYNFAASDKLKIETYSNGLLKKVDATSTDPLPEAVRQFAEFIISTATTGIGVPTPPALAGIEPFRSSLVFDPARFDEATIVFNEWKGRWEEGPCRDAEADKAVDPDVCSLASAMEFMRQRGVTLHVDVPRLERSAAAGAPEHLSEGAAAPRVSCSVGICYRFVLPYRIVVQDATTRAEAVYALPNQAPIGVIDVRRRGLVENKLIADFTNGVMTSLELDDPSLIIAALNIPIDVAKAIVSIPSALFRFTIAQETEKLELQAEKDLIEAQKQLLEQQIELLQKEQQLEKLQTPGATEEPT